MRETKWRTVNGYSSWVSWLREKTVEVEEELDNCFKIIREGGFRFGTMPSEVRRKERDRFVSLAAEYSAVIGMIDELSEPEEAP